MTAWALSLGTGLNTPMGHTEQTAKIESEQHAVKSFLDSWRLSSKRGEVRDQDVAKWDITCQGLDCLSLRIEGYACSQNFILMANTL